MISENPIETQHSEYELDQEQKENFRTISALGYGFLEELFKGCEEFNKTKSEGKGTIPDLLRELDRYRRSRSYQNESGEDWGEKFLKERTVSEKELEGEIITQEEELSWHDSGRDQDNHCCCEEGEC